jgi:RND family efflux transporter MFP subunit
VLLSAACGGNGEEEAEPELEVNADLVTVTPALFTEQMNAIGTVVPRAGAVALLSAPAATRVSHVYVSVGQRVARGAPLIEFEQGPFQARAQSAEAALIAAERGVERTRRLVEQGIIARRELDQAEAELAKARADAVAARREAQLARLHSPLTGVVTQMNAVLGASVDANQPLVEVANPQSLDIVVGVTPAQAGRVRPGVAVTLTAGESSSDTLGTGTVFDVGAAIDSATRSVPVRVRAGTTGRSLKIGESVGAGITVSRHAAAIVVPIEALVPEGEGFKVFVVGEDSIAHQRLVTVAGRGQGMAEISSGLQAGERVVTHGAFGVEEGARIVPRGKSP